MKNVGTENFVMLITGIADNDRLVKQMTGEQRPIYYKSRYVPPCETFNELRLMLLLVKSMADINGENTIAIDLSEWIGHEQEEYLTVMLKYLHDQRDHWRYIITVADHSRAEAARLYIRLKTYMAGSIIEDETFMSMRGLEEYLVTEKKLSREVSSELARHFFSREFKGSRGYEILEGVLAELRSLSGGRTVTLKVLREYLSREDSFMCLLLGRTVEVKEAVI